MNFFSNILICFFSVTFLQCSGYLKVITIICTYNYDYIIAGWMIGVGGWTYSTYQVFCRWVEGGREGICPPPPLIKSLVLSWNLFANIPTITLYVFQIHVLPQQIFEMDTSILCNCYSTKGQSCSSWTLEKCSEL